MLNTSLDSRYTSNTQAPYPATTTFNHTRPNANVSNLNAPASPSLQQPSNATALTGLQSNRNRPKTKIVSKPGQGVGGAILNENNIFAPRKISHSRRSNSY